MAAAFDSGDHLHPRKDALGALLSRVLGVDDAPNVKRSPSFLVPGLLLVGVAAMVVFRERLKE